MTTSVLPVADAYVNWLVAAAEKFVAAELQAAYLARVAQAQPLPVVVTRHQCPFCRATRAKPKAAAAHIARCWQNPDAHGCKTCTHLDQEPSGDDCFPGRSCNCNDGWERCTAGIPITDGLVTDCPLWAALTDR